MGIKVAELNTLSDAKGITGIRFFNEMEDTNESTNLRKLAETPRSQNHRSRVPNPSRASVAAAQPLKHVKTRKNEVLNSTKMK